MPVNYELRLSNRRSGIRNGRGLRNLFQHSEQGLAKNRCVELVAR